MCAPTRGPMASTMTVAYGNPTTIAHNEKDDDQPSCSGARGIIEAAVTRDLTAKRREYLFTPPRWLQRCCLPALQDSRDEPVALLLCNIILVTFPSALVVLLGPQRHWLGLIHVAVNYILLFPRFVVALLHVTEHRRLFRSGMVLAMKCPKLPACRGRVLLLSGQHDRLEWESAEGFGCAQSTPFGMPSPA